MPMLNKMISFRWTRRFPHEVSFVFCFFFQINNLVHVKSSPKWPLQFQILLGEMLPVMRSMYKVAYGEETWWRSQMLAWKKCHCRLRQFHENWVIWCIRIMLCNCVSGTRSKAKNHCAGTGKSLDRKSVV